MTLPNKDRIGDGVTHFIEILLGHVLDGVCVHLSKLAVSVVHRPPIRAVSFDEAVENANILKRTVHPLAIERHHRMGRVAKKQDIAIDIPRPTFNGPEITNRIVKEILGESRHERNSIGKFTLPKGSTAGFGCQLAE